MKRILACNLKFDLPKCRVNSVFHLPYGLAIILELLDKQGVKYDFYDTYLTGTSKLFLEYYKKNTQDVLLFSGIIGNYAYD